MPRNWRRTFASALLFVLAFNVIFFIQELFLVLPKALTPGLRPTLFHNNHTWEGNHPLASLFQGTGALAIFVTGLVCAVLLRRGAGRSVTFRLFLIWMTFSGFFQALPQVVIGAINPRNDVGMAMDYLRLGTIAKTMAAVAALAMVPPIALWLTRFLLGFARDSTEVATARKRARFIFSIATLPALIAIPLIILFRVPRELIEVMLPPAITIAIALPWMQAGAWHVKGANAHDNAGAVSIAYPLVGVVALLFVFQVLLRPGVRFY